MEKWKPRDRVFLVRRRGEHGEDCFFDTRGEGDEGAEEVMYLLATPEREATKMLVEVLKNLRNEIIKEYGYEGGAGPDLEGAIFDAETALEKAEGARMVETPRALRLQDPVLIIDTSDDGCQRMQMFPPAEKFQEAPALFWGVTLSDAIDHIARMQHQTTGISAETWRKRIKKSFEREEREKARDPGRGNLTGQTDFGRRN